MPEFEVIAGVIETLGIVAICLLWLKDKNDTIKFERDSRRDLSDDILEDWKSLKSQRSIQSKQDA